MIRRPHRRPAALAGSKAVPAAALLAVLPAALLAVLPIVAVLGAVPDAVLGAVPDAPAHPEQLAPQPARPRPGPPVGEPTRRSCGMPEAVHRATCAVGARPQVDARRQVGARPQVEARVVAGGGRAAEAAILWRRSRALGRPDRGRLVAGVRLPAEGAHFLTVDPVTRRSPSPAWRRYGTDRLLRVLLRVAEQHAAAHPGAPRLVVGDLSRPRGGRFGPEYGGDGHRSHQNGLDADVYYPRRDGRERVPTRVAQIHRRLAQELVDRFVRAGAQYVFVGPGTGLRGPAKVVMTLGNHDDHLHVRIRSGTRPRR